MADISDLDRIRTGNYGEDHNREMEERTTPEELWEDMEPKMNTMMLAEGFNDVVEIEGNEDLLTQVTQEYAGIPDMISKEEAISMRRRFTDTYQSLKKEIFDKHIATVLFGTKNEEK